MINQNHNSEVYLKTIDRELFEYSFQKTQEPGYNEPTRLEYLAEEIFDFTTYDSDMEQLFARKAVEVCAAITNKSTFKYIEDPENYRWYLLMVNMPFFKDRLEWGVSIRGAWWDHQDQVLPRCGLAIRGEVEEWISSPVRFTEEEWVRFISALVEFANAGNEAGSKELV